LILPSRFRISAPLLRHVLAIGEIKLKVGQEIYAPHRERATPIVTNVLIPISIFLAQPHRTPTT
jgi:hypothetical protein